jgi:hypothetical protein
MAKFRLFTACMFLLGAAACATASTETTSSAADSSQAADADNKQAVASKSDDEKTDGDERVCKKIRSTGSNFTRRKCQTRDEWDAEARASQDFLDDLGRKNRQGCTADQQC